MRLPALLTIRVGPRSWLGLSSSRLASDRTDYRLNTLSVRLPALLTRRRAVRAGEHLALAGPAPVRGAQESGVASPPAPSWYPPSASLSSCRPTRSSLPLAAVACRDPPNNSPDSPGCPYHPKGPARQAPFQWAMRRSRAARAIAPRRRCYARGPPRCFAESPRLTGVTARQSHWVCRRQCRGARRARGAASTVPRRRARGAVTATSQRNAFHGDGDQRLGEHFGRAHSAMRWGAGGGERESATGLKPGAGEGWRACPLSSRLREQNRPRPRPSGTSTLVEYC